MATFIDLFAGIGGLRLGFEAIGGECLFTCEWDRYSQKTYRANFPGDAHEIASDIRAGQPANLFVVNPAVVRVRSGFGVRTHQPKPSASTRNQPRGTPPSGLPWSRRVGRTRP